MTAIKIIIPTTLIMEGKKALIKTIIKITPKPIPIHNKMSVSKFIDHLI